MAILRTTALIDASAPVVSAALAELAARRARVASASDDEVVAILPDGPFRDAELSGRCTHTEAGTLLTCSLLFTGFWLHGAALDLLAAVADGTKARAESVPTR